MVIITPEMIRALTLIGFSSLWIACGGGDPQTPSRQAPEGPAPPAETPTAATPTRPPDAEATDDRVLIVFLGDSLTAGFGLDEGQAFPALVGARLKNAGRAVRVVNAGISGDTTAGGLARLDWLLRQKPDILFVGLGGNDGLRGVDLETSEANLRAILERAQAEDIRVLLAGMLIPPNYGPDYTDQFAEIYPRLAEEIGVPLIPFLLEAVAAREELNLPDGIHPNIEGQKLVAETVLPYVETLVDEVAAER